MVRDGWYERQGEREEKSGGRSAADNVEMIGLRLFGAWFAQSPAQQQSGPGSVVARSLLVWVENESKPPAFCCQTLSNCQAKTKEKPTEKMPKQNTLCYNVSRPKILWSDCPPASGGDHATAFLFSFIFLFYGFWASIACHSCIWFS